MTSTAKYSHRDIAQFILQDSVPQGLACSIGFGLMRQPVRISGDTSDHPYEARAAKRTLEVKRVNPFTRAPVRAEPALVPDPALQKAVGLFRAQVLGYTKVAAYLAATGQRLPQGASLALPTGMPPHQVVAGHILRNAWVKHIARRLVAQPVAPPVVPALPPLEILSPTQRARVAAMNALSSGLQASLEARGILANARQHATDGANAAAAAQTAANLGAAPQQIPSRAQTNSRLQTVDWSDFDDTFGGPIGHAARDLMLQPSAFSMQHLAALAGLRRVHLGEILLFDRGQVLSAILEDGAYEALMSVMPALVAGPQAASSDGSVGIGFLGEGQSRLFLGELQERIPHGRGVAVDVFGRGYSAGQWEDGVQQGSGQRRAYAPYSHARGHFVDGVLQQGVYSDLLTSLRGTFDGDQLSGWGELTSSTRRIRGLWESGRVVQGESITQQQEVILFGTNPNPGGRRLGSITYPDGSAYSGAIRRSSRWGFGTLTLCTGEMHIGLWRNDHLTGLGAIYHQPQVVLGRWHGASQPFEPMYTFETGEPVDFSSSSL